MALLGAPQAGPDTPLNIRLVCRSNPDVLYRSEAPCTPSGSHWQAMVDTYPEELAEQARPPLRPMTWRLP